MSRVKEFLFDCMEWAPLAMTIAFVLLVAAGIIGWVMNIAKLFALSWLTGEALVRLIGVILMPLGAVVGWF